MKSTYSRRKFVKNAGLLSAAGLLPAVATMQGCSEGGGGSDGRREGASIGIQTYMLRNILPGNPVGVIENLAELGYRELELFGLGGDLGSPGSLLFGLSVDRFARLVKALGLSVPCAHINPGGEDADYAGELIEALGIKYLVEPLGAEFIEASPSDAGQTGPTRIRDVLAVADRLNARAERVARLGVGFAYHNHSVEFKTVGRGAAWDILMVNTDPDLVKVELDVGWVAVAGLDPVEVLRKLSGRVVATHMKDFASDRPLPVGEEGNPFGAVTNLVPPGSGTVDFAAISRQLDTDGVEHRFVEVDVSADPMADAASGLRHLASLGR